MAKNKTTKELSGGCLILFGLPFLCAGLFLSGVYFVGFAKWWTARNWQETPCWIESAELKVSRGDDSDTYRALATYRYQYEGRTYHGDRVAFGGGSDNIGSFQQDAHRELSRYVAKKPPRAEKDPRQETGKPFRCFVNPAKPSEAVLYRTLRWQMQSFMAIFALTFPAVGAGIVVGGLWGMRRLKREAALRERHPGEPWKWKTVWAERLIPESSTPWTVALHAYTLWSGLIVVPLIVATWRSGAFEHGGSVWLLLIFAVLWSIPLTFSIKRLRHRMAVGSARFELKEVPASPGGMLRGSILLGNAPSARGEIGVTLFCEKSVTRGSGDGRSTTTEKVWSQRETLPLERVVRELTGFRLPVSFAIPADAPDSGEGDDPETKLAWKLDLAVPGSTVHSVFEVPVFRTGKSPRLDNAPSNVPSILDTASADLPSLLAERHIQAEFDAAGLPLSIVCPPARNRYALIFLLVFNLIWTTVAVFLIQQHAPLIFRLVWPVSAAIIWLIILWNLLHKRTVTFTATGLEVRNQLGPVVWSQSFDKSRIIAFRHETNMSSNNTSFYRVRLEDVTGSRKTLVDNITGSTTAAALVKRLEAWRK